MGTEDNVRMNSPIAIRNIAIASIVASFSFMMTVHSFSVDLYNTYMYYATRHIAIICIFFGFIFNKIGEMTAYDICRFDVDWSSFGTDYYSRSTWRKTSCKERISLHAFNEEMLGQSP